MAEVKHVPIPLAPHFHLSFDLCPKTQEEKDFMHDVPYKSAVGSIMYAMVSTCPDIAHVVGVVSRFMSNPCKWSSGYCGISRALLIMHCVLV